MKGIGIVITASILVILSGVLALNWVSLEKPSLASNLIVEQKIELTKDSFQTLLEHQNSLPETIEIDTLDYDTLQWTDILDLDNSIVIDLKYATTDNFVETQMYDCARCFLRPEVSKAVVTAHQALQKKGYGLKMFDCFRPRPIQWELWEKVPDPRYVADPRKGSMHNRGKAVDLTIVDSLGNELDMGTPFDFFGWKAYHACQDLPKEVLDNRKLLKETMEEFGFNAIKNRMVALLFPSKKL